jgi:hypothetical protein
MATGLEATDDSGERRSDNHFYENLGMAYFWPSWEATPVPNKRVLQGELELLRTLKPSFKFPNFSIRVRTTSSLIRKSKSIVENFSTLSISSPSRQQDLLRQLGR